MVVNPISVSFLVDSYLFILFVHNFGTGPARESGASIFACFGTHRRHATLGVHCSEA